MNRFISCATLLALVLVISCAKSPTNETDRRAVSLVKELRGEFILDSKLPDRPVIFINLSDTDATDEHVRTLQHLTSLKSLYLDGSKVTDDGIDALAQIKNLDDLSLHKTAVSDIGVRRLVSLGSLKKLNLDSTKVTDACAEFLALMPNLQSLSLALSTVGDSALEKLSSHQKLTYLTLAQSKVTDKGLRHLAKMTGLKLLVLYHCDVTVDGVEEFKKAVPGCDVRY